MAGRRLNIEWRAEDTPEALKAAWQTERDHAVKTRLHGLWMLRRGMNVSEVTRALEVHSRSVRRWMSWYRTGGLQEVTARRRGGKGGQSRLSEEQVSRLAWEMKKGRLVTAEDVRNWIAYQYGVIYTMPGVYSLMQRARTERVALGFRVQRDEPGLWQRISARLLRLLSLAKERLAPSFITKFKRRSGETEHP
ncbi:MAG: helix-turn-helix domain-containing protein [Chloroflexi bacterium]|nr:helix-turn-helix domain-containing protein [Chloroflexota bacterium]